MFSVPPGASTGPHPIALRNAQGTSSTVTYTVTVPVPWDGPRIDEIGLVSASFSGGNVAAWLYVQGANIDVGAEVSVDGSAVATVAHRGLQMDWYGVPAGQLGFPIRHYLSLLAVPGEHAAGSTISVTVTNLDGATSPAVQYALPADKASLDSDNDNLPDQWELSGYDADGDGAVDVDLPALGANPLQPDIFVEVDLMNGLNNPPIATVAATGTTPAIPGTFDTAIEFFAKAPQLNPKGERGIALHLDTSGTMANTAVLHFGTILPSSGTSTDFATLKTANFAEATRDRIYHYAIWADALVGGYSGVSDVDFGGTNSGDDFVVTFDNFSASFQTLRSQVETFVHELGHNLGFRHGGLTHELYNPNYWSAMSYTWQLRSGRNNATRRNRVTCTPIYWANPGATEPNGAGPASPNAVTDYSHGIGPTITENNNSLQEATGVCGAAVDWNNDGDTTDSNLSTNANDASGSAQVIQDVSNWASLDYTGPEDNGDL